MIHRTGHERYLKRQYNALADKLNRWWAKQQDSRVTRIRTKKGNVKLSVKSTLCGVYKLIFAGSNDVYVGASSNIRRRLQGHRLEYLGRDFHAVMLESTSSRMLRIKVNAWKRRLSKNPSMHLLNKTKPFRKKYRSAKTKGINTRHVAKLARAALARQQEEEKIERMDALIRQQALTDPATARLVAVFDEVAARRAEEESFIGDPIGTKKYS